MCAAMAKSRRSTRRNTFKYIALRAVAHMTVNVECEGGNVGRILLRIQFFSCCTLWNHIYEISVFSFEFYVVDVVRGGLLSKYLILLPSCAAF